MKSKCEDYDLIKALVEYLNKDRVEEYNTWLDVGFCLYNIDEDLLELWDDFSKKSDKYKSGECDRFWSKMDKKNFTIGGLRYWAKEDNPENY